MPAVLLPATEGRGAWPRSGRGGTVNSEGTGAGAYYRVVEKPPSGPTPLMVGLAGFRAERNSTECSVDDYAVWCAVVEVQRVLQAQTEPALAVDGLWGRGTDTALRTWQRANNRRADGVYGTASARGMWEPYVRHAAGMVEENPEFATVMVGIVGYESGWDPAAVGRTSPNDLGLAQLNGPSHPALSARDRLTPSIALLYAARWMHGNYTALDRNMRDAIAAYNLGLGGVRKWIEAGRPRAWQHNPDVVGYVESVLKAAKPT